MLSLKKRTQIVQDLYLADEKPWLVAFSGGKDSTAVLQLIWRALKELPRSKRQKPLDVCYVDTGMEHPAYDQHLRGVLREIASAADAQRMPVGVRILEPELRHRFFVAVIGRGYAPPTHWFRWCTKGMRIRPMSKFIKSQLTASGAVVIVLGLRRAESHARAEVLKRYSAGQPFMGRYGNMSGALAFTPIEDFDTAAVWQFLMQIPCPWGGSNRKLMQLYSRAAGGECPSYSLGGGLGPSCGGSRFGCWTCTVVRTDKSGGALAEEDDTLAGLVAYRDWLAEMRYDKHRRWRIRRNGKPGPGPLTMATRREALTRLLEVEKLSSRPLIRSEEIEAIQALWTSDGDRKDSALSMYRAHSTAELVQISCAAQPLISGLVNRRRCSEDQRYSNAPRTP
jgi:DNA sulfur modification protein DndC